MKIINKRRFIITVTVLIFILLGIIDLFKATYSKSEIGYEEIYIYNGDTLWSIAKEQVNNNKYFENKDIREVVYNLKEVNNIKYCDLYEGQVLKIPVYK